VKSLQLALCQASNLKNIREKPILPQACNREECLQKSGHCNSPPLTMKFKRWNTFWVVQPYSGTRSSIRINWICKPLLLVSKRKIEHPEFGHPKMRVPKPFQITKRQIIGICNNPWKMHMFYVLISWNWILIRTVKHHGSHHQTMHKQGSKSHLHFEKKMQSITEQDDCHFAISREPLNFRD
jgi:hypothetical protein